MESKMSWLFYDQLASVDCAGDIAMITIAVSCMYVSSDVIIIEIQKNETVLCICRIGRKSARLVRAAALRLADELMKMLARPSTALVTRCQEG